MLGSCVFIRLHSDMEGQCRSATQLSNTHTCSLLLQNTGKWVMHLNTASFPGYLSMDILAHKCATWQDGVSKVSCVHPAIVRVLPLQCVCTSPVQCMVHVFVLLLSTSAMIYHFSIHLANCMPILQIPLLSPGTVMVPHQLSVHHTSGIVHNTFLCCIFECLRYPIH